jgi:N-acetylglutamate synthase-like GNAT family acetyltransferase
MSVALPGWRVRTATAADLASVTAFLVERGSKVVARLGRLEQVGQAPKLIAEEHGSVVGALSYLIEEGECEVLTLHAVRPGRGIGTALLQAVETVARANGCSRLWLVTTNDNIDALRFYQRRGFRLVRVDAGAVDRSRTMLKPSIPRVGDHGIPIRDELLLEKPLGGPSG